MPQSTRNSLRQTVISWFLLILLVLIAVAIGFKQKSYQKSDFDSAILSADLFTGNFTAAEDIENYNSGSLYEKIDGKADLYLGNGFISLQCRRFIDNSAKDRWAEVYLYDMADGENAFAVYSIQKRPESTPLDWAQFGYSASDSVYAAFGKYYMEIILSFQDNSLLTSAQNAAKQLSSAISAGKIQMPVFDLFPTDNLVADSFKFINADAFSCSDLKNIFTAEYNINGNTITAYLSKDNASETFTKYHRFLMDNGGKEISVYIWMFDCRAIELFGTTDIFFKTGDFFAGVRGSAPSRDLNIIVAEFMKSFQLKNDKR